MKYCVYFLIDPTTNLPFYVGSGLYPKRPLQHFKKTQILKDGNTHKSNKIKKLLLNFKEDDIIEIVQLSNSREDMLNLEQLYIDTYKLLRKGGILVNVVSVVKNFLKNKISESGKDKHNKTLSYETKMKISDSKKGTGCGKDNSFYGKKHSEETKLKISESLKKSMSEERKRKISESMKRRIKNK